MDSWGVFFTVLAYGAGAGIYFWASRRTGLERSTTVFLMAVGLTAGAAGAKIAQVLVDQGGPAAILIPGGRAIFAGILTGWLGVEIAKRAIRLTLPTGDAFALALAGGEAIGRIGCHFHQCCYGRVCETAWAVHHHGADRYPVQLISGAVAAAIFGFLLWMRGRVERPGLLFSLYLIVWAASRFGLEFLREPQGQLGPLTLMQWVCIETVVVGVILLSIRLRKKAPQAAQA